MSGRRGFLKRVLGLGAGAAVIAADPTVALAKWIGPGDGVAASEKALREQIRAEVEQQMLTRLQTELERAREGWMSSIDVRKLEESPIEQMMPDPLGPYGWGSRFGPSASMPASWMTATLGAVPWPPSSGYQVKQVLQIPRYAPLAMPTDERITARIEMQNGSVIAGGPTQRLCCYIDPVEGNNCQNEPSWYIYYAYDDDTYACDRHKARMLDVENENATAYRYSISRGIDYSSGEPD